MLSEASEKTYLLFIKHYLIKKWIVAFLDVGSLCLASHSYFDNRFDIDTRQLSSLDDSNPHLNIIMA